MGYRRMGRFVLGCTAAIASLACGSGFAASPTTTPAANSLIARRCQLGYVLLWNKDFPGAEQEFRKAVAADAEYEDARLGLALALERKGDLSAAAAEYEHIKSDSPQQAVAMAGRARILTSQRKFEPALELYEKLKEKSALTDEYRLKYVETLGLSGNSEKAVAELAPLRADAKLAPEIAKLEGQILFWGGRAKEAVPKLVEALAKSPKDDDLRLDLAQALLQSQQQDEAIKVLEGLSDRGAKSMKAYLLRVDILVSQKQYDRAAEFVRDCIKQDPKAAEPLETRLAEILSWTQKYDEAIKLYRGLLQRHPDDAQIRSKLAETLTWAGRFDEAAAEYRAALGENSK